MTVRGGAPLFWSVVKSTTETAVTVTPIVAVLEPSAFVAVNVTRYVPGTVNTWSSGSCKVELGEPSLKSHSQLVGLPPEVSRKTTLKGAGPLSDEGDTSPLPVN